MRVLNITEVLNVTELKRYFTELLTKNSVVYHKVTQITNPPSKLKNTWKQYDSPLTSSFTPLLHLTQNTGITGDKPLHMEQ